MGSPSFQQSVLSNVFPQAKLPVQNLVVRQVPTFTAGGQVQQATQVTYSIGPHSFTDTYQPGEFSQAKVVAGIQANVATVQAVTQAVAPQPRRVIGISQSGADVGYFPDLTTAIAWAEQQLGSGYTYVPFNPTTPLRPGQFTLSLNDPALAGPNRYSLAFAHYSNQPIPDLFTTPSFLGGTGVTAGATVAAPGGPSQPSVPVPGPFAPTPAAAPPPPEGFAPPPAGSQPPLAVPPAAAAPSGAPPAAPRVVLNPTATSVVQTGFDASSVQGFLQANGYGVLRVIDLGLASDPAVAASLGVDVADPSDPRHWFEAFFE